MQSKSYYLVFFLSYHGGKFPDGTNPSIPLPVYSRLSNSIRTDTERRLATIFYFGPEKTGAHFLFSEKTNRLSVFIYIFFRLSKPSLLSG